ncbi:hypothetical protein BGZ63DRAFT_370769 [Mariannaea sp. PMI_226]|nr:hypothetical protein BGZ63DRAFT_370769 [Mariannaea sp. PMI_226]
MSSPKLNLLDLPVDVLSLIFLPLLVSSSPILLCPCSSKPNGIDPLPLLLIHPSIHAIVVPLLFSANEFVLDATGTHTRHVRQRLEDSRETVTKVSPWAEVGDLEQVPASLLTTQDALRRLANLQIRFERLRAWVHDEFVPMLTDMVVNGSLEHLTIWVRTPAGERQQRTQISTGTRGREVDSEEDDLAMFIRPPLEGILRVLADPYLRTARLLVDRQRHLPGWCRFHAAGEGLECGTLGRSGAGAGMGRESRGGPLVATATHTVTTACHGEMLEVDWRELLKVVDPDKRDVAVAADGTRRYY